MTVSPYVVIPAGGSGTRMGLPYPKQLMPMGKSTMLEHTLSLFDGYPIYVAYPKEFEAIFREKIGEKAHLVEGGATRFDSVHHVIEAIDGLQDDDLVLIHDAARPFLDTSDLEQALELATRTGAVIYARQATDTIKRIGEGMVVKQTLDREKIYHAQTPQIFRAGLLRKGYKLMGNRGGFTDEAGLLEACGIRVTLFATRSENRKITHPEDLALMKQNTLRIGHGYDVHRFDPQRPLMLGGVHIENAPGLAGHSDADVAIHALIDALLGAAGLGDIGHWFPDTDPELAGVDSTVLLTKVWEDLDCRGYQLINADITIQAQAPKLAPHIPKMRARLGELLDCEAINIKATTTEKMGFVGRKEGMAADAVVLLEQS